MIEAGLLEEVYNIYTLNADYTRGLRQAIGVREFEDFLHAFLSDVRDERHNSCEVSTLLTTTINSLRQKLREIVESSADIPHRTLLEDGIDKLKANTRRLVRRQVSILPFSYLDPLAGVGGSPKNAIKILSVIYLLHCLNSWFHITILVPTIAEHLCSC